MKLTPGQKQFASGVAEALTRALRVVSLLGGIVRAEKIAETIGSEG